jgi:hypothetical protein
MHVPPAIIIHQATEASTRIRTSDDSARILPGRAESDATVGGRVQSTGPNRYSITTTWNVAQQEELRSRDRVIEALKLRIDALEQQLQRHLATTHGAAEGTAKKR